MKIFHSFALFVSFLNAHNFNVKVPVHTLDVPWKKKKKKVAISVKLVPCATFCLYFISENISDEILFVNYFYLKLVFESFNQIITTGPVQRSRRQLFKSLGPIPSPEPTLPSVVSTFASKPQLINGDLGHADHLSGATQPGHILAHSKRPRPISPVEVTEESYKQMLKLHKRKRILEPVSTCSLSDLLLCLHIRQLSLIFFSLGLPLPLSPFFFCLFVFPAMMFWSSPLLTICPMSDDYWLLIDLIRFLSIFTFVRHPTFYHLICPWYS